MSGHGMAAGLNRTIQELKFFYVRTEVSIYIGLNRTIQELK